MTSDYRRKRCACVRAVGTTGAPHYRDDHHLNETGAAAISGAIAEQEFKTAIDP